MNRTQKKLAIAGAITVAAIAAMVSMSGRNEFTKHDMLGIVPGMTREQVEKLITSRKWVCAATASNDVACKTDAGALTIAFAATTALVRSAQIRLANHEKLSFDATAKAVSAQYGRSPAEATPTQATWTLDDRLSLRLVQDGAMVLTLAAGDPGQRR